MSTAQFPVTRKLLIYELSHLTKNSDQNWKPFSKERRRELKQFENSLFFIQLSRNNFVYAWKQIYEDVNEYCGTFCIPYKNQEKLYMLELFFNEDDTISTACKKWLDFIIDVYNFSWDVFANKIKYSEFNNQDIVKV